MITSKGAQARMPASAGAGAADPGRRRRPSEDNEQELLAITQQIYYSANDDKPSAGATQIDQANDDEPVLVEPSEAVQVSVATTTGVEEEEEEERDKSGKHRRPSSSKSEDSEMMDARGVKRPAYSKEAPGKSPVIHSLENCEGDDTDGKNHSSVIVNGNVNNQFICSGIQHFYRQQE